MAVFVLLQLTILTTALIWANHRASELRRTFEIPLLSNTPIVVRPTHDVPETVSDEQLGRVLLRLRPQFRGNNTRINHVDHALRFWTADAHFDNSDSRRLADLSDEELARFNDPTFHDARENIRYLSGSDLTQLLTDNDLFARVYSREQPSLLIDHELGGVRVRVQEGAATSSHVDHTIACLAEVGTPLNFPVVTPGRSTTFGAMVEQAWRDFSLNQQEYEWSAMVFAMYLPPNRSFVSAEGQTIDFDLLAFRIMREDLPHGVCFGNHRLYTLVILLRIDEESPILRTDTRGRIVEYLKEVTRRLEQSQQRPDGYWDGHWSGGVSSENATGDELADRLLATGHALEWWAMAPSELHPNPQVLQSAGQWLVRQITEDLTDSQIQQYYTYLTHAGRALALWRSQTPAEVDLDN